MTRHLNWLVCLICTSLFSLHAAQQRAFADFIYASQVVSVIGGSGGPVSVVLGPPQPGSAAGFIQLADNTQLTLSFPLLLRGQGLLRVFNFDLPFPAAAKIELSEDNISYVELLPPPGELWYDSNPERYFDISVNLGPASKWRFIRFTDLPGSVDGDTSFGGRAGFDLDAVGFEVVPEPATGCLLLLTGLPLLHRQRNSPKSIQ